MADNNQQVGKPELKERALKAQDEFAVILDVLMVPLRADVSNKKLPPPQRVEGRMSSRAAVSGFGACAR